MRDVLSDVPTWGELEDLRPALRSFLARRCRDESELDDVVQETLLRAARYRGSLTRSGSLRPWALRIAANVLCDRVRVERRLPWVEVDDGDLNGLAATHEHPLGDEPEHSKDPSIRGVEGEIETVVAVYGPIGFNGHRRT